MSDIALRDTLNAEAELAYRYVTETNRNIFLTGKAGTGKTTFLHRVRTSCSKQLIVVAPTGVAAINAKGVTIHSQFQLPFGNLLPDQLSRKLGQRQLKREKQRLLRGLDLLVIDEISMVRADVLDAIDWTLRRYRDRGRPFGGVQLLMIGDLHQLAPVVREEEWLALRQHYKTPYFFSSLALRGAGVVRIELKKIYRQSDADFVALLNQVRENQLTPEVLTALNSRHTTGEDDDRSGAITLSSHRAAAQTLNGKALAALDGQLHAYNCEVTGTFPAHLYPTEEQIELKVGAQVMFVKNDPPPNRFYYNGKIGRISAIDEDGVHVSCEGEAVPIVVAPVTWDNSAFVVDEKTKEVSEEVIGTFRQLPLRLAWAITIHKSQGLTFDRVNIDAASAFAHGQVYVALSRCRTLEGIRLVTPIGNRAVKTDAHVNSYSRDTSVTQPTSSDLASAKTDFRKQLVQQAFNLEPLAQRLRLFLRYYLEHETSFARSASSRFEQLVAAFEQQLLAHAQGFRPILQELQQAQDYTSPLVPVAERTRKGAAYFFRGLDELVTTPLTKITFVSDNKSVMTKVFDHLREVARLVRESRAMLSKCTSDFDAEAFVRARAHASLEEDPSLRPAKSSSRKAKEAELLVSKHAALYQTLHAWRKTVVEDQELKSPSSVCSTKVLVAVSNELPRSLAAFGAIKGVGKKTLAAFGKDIVDRVVAYCEQNDIAADAGDDATKADAAEPHTRAVSLALFKQGLSVAKIAAERSIKPDTVYGHLLDFLGLDEAVTLHSVLPAKALAEIRAALQATRSTATGRELVSHLRAATANQYAYGVVEACLNHLQANSAEHDA